MAVNTVGLHWIDSDGKKAVHSFRVPDSMDDPLDPLITDVINAVANLNSAGITYSSMLMNAVSPDTADTGAYDASDKLVVQMRNADGGVTSFQIAAPREAILPDSDHAGVSDVAFNDFLAELAEIAVSRGAAALITHIRSYRSKKN